MPDHSPSRILAVGHIALGVGFLVAGVKEWASAGQAVAGVGSPKALPPPTFPGRVVARTESAEPIGATETLDQAMQRTKGSLRTVTKHHVRSIEERVALLRDLARRGGEDPAIREAAAAILSRKCGKDFCVQPKAYVAEAVAIHRAVIDPRSRYAVRYTRDHPKIDTFTAAGKTMKLRIGDCDDLSIYEASLLLAAGHEPELVVIQAKGAPTWSHVFVRTPKRGSDGVAGSGRGRSPDDYLVLDPSMPNRPAGWEPPGLSRALVGGGASGIVEKARVFRIV